MKFIRQRSVNGKTGPAFSRAFSTIICAMFFSFLCGCVDFSIRNLNSSGKNIVCFGDSLTLGYGADKASSYPEVLSHLSSFKIINSGLSGDTTHGALQRLQADVLDREPVLVILEFGGNDLLVKVPLQDTINNLSQIIDKIQEKGAMVAVVDISSSIFFEEYRDAFRALCREKGAIFIARAMEGIITDPSLKSDYLHPNSHGYRIMAHRIYRAIMPYLNRNIIARGIAQGA